MRTGRHQCNRPDWAGPRAGRGGLQGGAGPWPPQRRPRPRLLAQHAMPPRVRCQGIDRRRGGGGELKEEHGASRQADTRLQRLRGSAPGPQDERRLGKDAREALSPEPAPRVSNTCALSPPPPRRSSLSASLFELLAL